MDSGSNSPLILCQGRWMYPVLSNLIWILFWSGRSGACNGPRFCRTVVGGLLRNFSPHHQIRPGVFIRSVRYRVCFFGGKRFMVRDYVIHLEQLQRKLRRYVSTCVTPVADNSFQTLVNPTQWTGLNVILVYILGQAIAPPLLVDEVQVHIFFFRLRCVVSSLCWRRFCSFDLHSCRIWIHSFLIGRFHKIESTLNLLRVGLNLRIG